VNAAAGISVRKIWRTPLPTVVRIPPRSPRVANRESAGNSTVASATLNIPCGSM